jgi:hypothetical protein
LRRIYNSATTTETRNFTTLSGVDHRAFDIFLCHSYLDKEEVKGLYLDLTRNGYSVYVDWIIDPDLDRNKVTKETAEQVRKRLRSSKSLLLAFSANAGISKWVPWELGYVDGNKQNCAIIPVAETDNASYIRAEYLQLYPILEGLEIAYQNMRSLYITESAYQYVDLSSWLQGAKPAHQNKML